MTTTWLVYFPSPARGVWHLGPIPIRAYALCIIVGIVAALHRAGLGQSNSDAVAILQTSDQPGMDTARAEAGLFVERFGRLIERLDMVVIGVEELADLLERHARADIVGALLIKCKRFVHKISTFFDDTLIIPHGGGKVNGRGKTSPPR